MISFMKPPRREEGGWGLHPQQGFGDGVPDRSLSSYRIFVVHLLQSHTSLTTSM